jgi:hypothetical protein
LVVEKKRMWLFEPDRYSFSISNDRTNPASEVVFLASDRCCQENLIAQSKGRVTALAILVDSLVSTWAYMALAWQAWSPKGGRHCTCRYIPAGGETPYPQAVAAADEALDTLRGADPEAVPVRQDSRSDRLPPPVVKPMVVVVPPPGGAAPRRAAALTARSPNAETRAPVRVRSELTGGGELRGQRGRGAEPAPRRPARRPGPATPSGRYAGRQESAGYDSSPIRTKAAQ